MKISLISMLWFVAFAGLVIATLAGCASSSPVDPVEYPPPNCIFLETELPVVCWVDLPGEPALIYRGDARLLCEDQGPHRWLVIDRKSNEKLQIVGGRCVALLKAQ